MIRPEFYDTEKKALEALVNGFSKQMKTKVLKKLKEGYVGWENPDFIPYMFKQLDNHVKKCDWVDVANIAMFLSNFDLSCIDIKEIAK